MSESNATAATAQHPLGVTRTELVWEGKYDSAGLTFVTSQSCWFPMQNKEILNFEEELAVAKN